MFESTHEETNTLYSRLCEMLIEATNAYLVFRIFFAYHMSASCSQVTLTCSWLYRTEDDFESTVYDRRR